MEIPWQNRRKESTYNMGMLRSLHVVVVFPVGKNFGITCVSGRTAGMYVGTVFVADDFLPNHTLDIRRSKLTMINFSVNAYLIQ
jgi:hypothetical protein